MTASISLDNTAARRQMAAFNFKGLLAPVFTCFTNDEHSLLSVDDIDRYARWLKSKNVAGVLVNGITGEGPALGVQERKLNAEAWFKAAEKHGLGIIVQVGGAPLPDVMDLAAHAENLGVNGVVCLPELFYKPQTVLELIAYCKQIAKKCVTRSFLYNHVPRFTDININMSTFCDKALEHIPNFYGVQFSMSDLDDALKCLKSARVVLLGSSTMLASGLLLGFESFILSTMNICPDLVSDIYNAMAKQDVQTAKEKQKQLSQLLQKEIQSAVPYSVAWVAALKKWFNRQSTKSRRGAGFSAGRARSFF